MYTTHRHTLFVTGRTSLMFTAKDSFYHESFPDQTQTTHTNTYTFPCFSTSFIDANISRKQGKCEWEFYPVPPTLQALAPPKTRQMTKKSARVKMRRSIKVWPHSFLLKVIFATVISIRGEKIYNI